MQTTHRDVKERLKLVVHIACVGIFGDQIQVMFELTMNGSLHKYVVYAKNKHALTHNKNTTANYME